MKKLPDFSFEKRLWKKDYKFVAGCDEVGRGCFAGPVVTSCVVFQKNTFDTFDTFGTSDAFPKIDDSKKLSAVQRERAAKWIKKNSLAWGIGVGKVSEINRLGMSKATYSAFRRSITIANKKTGSRVDYLLIDAFYIPYVRGLRIPLKTLRLRSGQAKKFGDLEISGRQLAIIDGDEKSLSIAAASIIAKVYRDRLMESLSKKSKFKKYGWDKNKGYGTKKHQEAILRHGITKFHRKKFIESFLLKANHYQLTNHNYFSSFFSSPTQWKT